jgi:hypothetical protein
MDMVCRAALAALAVLAGLLAGAAPAPAEQTLRPSLYYLGRADARMCPSPYCGGFWIWAVNTGEARCADRIGPSCYVAALELDPRLDEARRARLTRLFGTGRALMDGHLAAARIEGFPELRVLDASEVWPSSSSPANPRGVFYFLRDTGARCVTTPCFSIRATRLSSPRELTLSSVDLSAVGIPEAERRRALAQLERRGLIAAGRIVVEPNAGPAGAGRTLVASQLYVRALP